MKNWICLLLLLAACTKHITSGTETDTGQIVGIVVYVNNQGVNDADVILRSSDLVKLIKIGNSKETALGKKIVYIGKRFDSTKTTPAGVFQFDTVDTGHFYIEVNDHDSLGALVEASVSPAELNVFVDTMVLKKFGAIKGNIDSSLIRKNVTYVYIVELGRTVPVDSLGNFLINNVPISSYTIRLVSGNSAISSPLDTIKIPVSEKDTTGVYNIGSKTGTLIIEGTIKEY